MNTNNRKALNVELLRWKIFLGQKHEIGYIGKIEKVTGYDC
jgi:hypothetical protein